MSLGAATGAHQSPTGNNALGHFLKARHEELGLSREGLVGKILLRTGYRLSASHYYRIERGVQMPSADTLDNIADALDLDQDGTVYVHSLIVEKPRPTPIMPHQAVPEAVRRVMRFQEPASAYVIDRRLDILAWNDATCDIYGFDLDTIKHEHERNVAWLMFSNPTLLRGLHDWEVHAQQIVAFCRSRWAGLGKDRRIKISSSSC